MSGFVSWVRRHRRKFVISGAVLGGLYLVGKVAERQMAKWQVRQHTSVKRFHYILSRNKMLPLHFVLLSGGGGTKGPSSRQKTKPLHIDWEYFTSHAPRSLPRTQAEDCREPRHRQHHRHPQAETFLRGQDPVLDRVESHLSVSMCGPGPQRSLSL